MHGEKTYRPWSPGQSFLLPPSPLEWLPQGHLAYFILDVLVELDLSAIERTIQAKDSRGNRPFSPHMMTALLLYAYCVGVFSSRKIERATFEDVAFRVLAGGEHPHFTTVNQFRKDHLGVLKELFVQVLHLCQKAGLVKLGQVAVDGTKVQANASKHKAMSYKHMDRRKAQLQAEIDELFEQAQQVDEEEDARYGEGQREEDLPEEMRRREVRRAKIREAKTALEAEAREARAAVLRQQAEKAREAAKSATTQREQKRAERRAEAREKTASALAPRIAARWAEDQRAGFAGRLARVFSLNCPMSYRLLVRFRYTRRSGRSLASLTSWQRLQNLLGVLQAAALLLAVTACGGRAPSAEAAVAVASASAVAPKVDIAGVHEPRGIRVNHPQAQPGYTLFGPILSDTTYLIDSAGQVVHTWTSEFAPSGGIYLLDDGNLLRPVREPEVERFSGGGQGGRIQEFTWDGELVWDFLFASEEHLTHHDVEVLPNGNVLAIAWEHKSADEVRRAGRNPSKVPAAGLWPDMVVEIEPQRPDGGKIVWEWHAWDHLVQNRSKRLPDYGDPAQSPGRIDVNAGMPPETTPEELEKLKALGYVSADTTEEDLKSDFFHTNAIDYNAELDQIALSTPRYNEVWIIDHSTTTAEAAGSRGGRWGRGGDLLYRWGNPANYGRGDESSQTLFAQHDARWIPDGHPGAGNLTVFSNAMGDDSGPFSSVYELAPPTAADGSYLVPEDGPFGPREPLWSYRGSAESFFFAPFISGAERQPNGNTLICSGPQGRFLEVTPDGDVVWEFWDPRQGQVRLPDGSPPHPVDEFTHAVFRAARIVPEHPALGGRELRPLEPQPPVVVGYERAVGSAE